MCKGLIGKKIGMMSYFTEDGIHIPVTVLRVGPCKVTQVKSKNTDGYSALQLGFGEKRSSRVNKPLIGHFQKSGGTCYSFLQEVSVENPDEFKIGQEFRADMFKVGEKVDVIGVTKGRGFQGVVKRHGFSGGGETHGSMSHRVPGSIGCSAWPSKVIKGKKLPGQYGVERKTVRNLEIVDIRLEDNLILVKGAIPGSNTSIVTVKKLKFSK